MACLNPFATQKGLPPYVFLSVITSWCPDPPGVRNRPHLKPHPPDSDRVALPGAVIFAHLRDTGLVAEHSIGAPILQVCETVHT